MDKFVKKTIIFTFYFAVFTSIVHIWMNSFSLIMVIKKNAIHLGLMLGLTFLMFPFSKNKEKVSIFDWILSILGLLSGIYIYLVFDRLVETSLVPIPIDYLFAVMTIILILEAARRSVGNILPLLSIIFILYAKYGRVFPGIFAHQGFTWKRILTRMYLTTDGIYGVTLMVSASYVFMFILFGAFLNKSGTASFFNDFALAFAGKFRGGPAKVAIIASGLMGTISGSSQANVATTGAFTIPLMKEVGYSKRFSAAVEAAASTGGILMPPIMGAASFMMASFLGLPYTKVMIAGAIPALFYYFGIFVMVDIEAQKLKLTGLSDEEIPDLKNVLKRDGHLGIPVLVILVLLLKGLTPLYSAFFGLLSVIIFSSLKKHTRMGFKTILSALEEGAKSAVSVAIACAVVGFIVGVVTMTGLGQILAHNILALSFGKTWLALVLVMVASIFLGMGLPATACYIITASIAAPALINMGIDPLAAHFFAFYFGTLSAVVPPVALTSYTAAGLSGANPTKVAFTGFKLASAGLIIPFMFAFNPIILMQGDVQAISLIITVVSGLSGIYFLAAANEKYLGIDLNNMKVVVLLIAAFLLVYPGILTDLIGLALGGAIIRINKRKKEEMVKLQEKRMI